MAESEWQQQREQLLGHRISELGLAIRGSRVERLVDQLYSELEAHGVRYRPAVYLSDQWGCPDGTPLIGVPFYLADPRLERIEAEMAMTVEDVLSRRTRCLLLCATASRRAAPRVAAMLAEEHDHDQAWIAAQLAEFEQLVKLHLPA